MLLALLPLSNGARILGAQNEFMQVSQPFDAVVVAQAPTNKAKPQRANAETVPVVEFVDISGVRRTARTNVASYPPAFELGDRITFVCAVDERQTLAMDYPAPQECKRNRTAPSKRGTSHGLFK